MIEETLAVLEPKIKILHQMLKDPHPGLPTWCVLFEKTMYDCMCTWFEKTGQNPNDLLDQLAKRIL